MNPTDDEQPCFDLWADAVAMSYGRLLDCDGPVPPDTIQEDIDTRAANRAADQIADRNARVA